MPRTPFTPRPLRPRVPTTLPAPTVAPVAGDRVAATYDPHRTGTVARLIDGGAEVNWADGLRGWAPLSMLQVLS